MILKKRRKNDSNKIQHHIVCVFFINKKIKINNTYTQKLLNRKQYTFITLLNYIYIKNILIKLLMKLISIYL